MERMASRSLSRHISERAYKNTKLTNTQGGFYVYYRINLQLGYIVTEDFLAPVKGVPLVQRLYHDIFDDPDAAQYYADNLKLHDLRYPKSIVTFLVCNRQEVSGQPWYQNEKEAMRLMTEKGQAHLDDSFCIFTKTHIEKLKKIII